MNGKILLIFLGAIALLILGSSLFSSASDIRYTERHFSSLIALLVVGLILLIFYIKKKRGSESLPPCLGEFLKNNEGPFRVLEQGACLVTGGIVAVVEPLNGGVHQYVYISPKDIAANAEDLVDNELPPMFTASLEHSPSWGERLLIKPCSL